MCESHLTNALEFAGKSEWSHDKTLTKECAGHRVELCPFAFQTALPIHN